MVVADPERITVPVPGLNVSALAWGPADGALALCLHGYPDTAWTYRYLGPFLAERGWRVVAPFNRGYLPTGVASDGVYQVGALVRDALNVAGALRGDEPFVLIGHDWGAAAATGAAVVASDRIRRLVTMAVPPIPAFYVDKRVLLRQALPSWYQLANNMPVLPEMLFTRFVQSLWRRWSPGYDATEDLTLLWESLPTRAERSAALDYYRFTFQPWRQRTELKAEERAWQQVPPMATLYLHGERDGCVRSAVAAPAGELLPPGSAAHVVSGCGHFLQLERPDTVNQLIADFITG
jgi:pimeloyl-ACP methyl ester carboxylesterase